MSNVLSPVQEYLAGIDLLDAPGAVLYSGIETVTPGPVYLLGLNPGGSGNETLRASLGASRSGNNAYLDEEWEPAGRRQPKGQSTLQRRVQYLCAAMGLDTRRVPASNLAFTRSTRLGTHFDFDAAVRQCAPVHAMLLDVIQPRFLMTFGSLGNVAKAVTIVSVEHCRADHGEWQAHRGVVRWGEREMAFGNVPHLSLWAGDKRPAVVEWAIAPLRG